MIALPLTLSWGWHDPQDIFTGFYDFGKAAFLLEKLPIVEPSRHANRKSTIKISMLKAILTDSQFWIPLIVLLLGVVLLVSLH